MKNAMKKLMAFALVAVMLVGALPFAAFAAEEPITFVVVGSTYGEEGLRNTHTPSNPDGNTIQQLLNHFNIDLENNEFSHAMVWPAEGEKYQTSEISAQIAPGSSVRVRVNGITNKPDDEVPDDGEDEGAGDNEDASTNEGTEKEETVDYIVVKVNIGSSSNTVYQQNVYPAENGEATVGNLLKYYFARQSEYGKDWEKTYYFSHAWSSVNQENVEESDSIKVGDTVSIRLMPIETKDEDKNDETTTKYVEVYVYVDGEKQSSSATKLYKNSELVSDILDDVKSSSWSFLGFKIDGEGNLRTNGNVEVEPGQTIKMYFETKESKANSSKVYLHVFMNNDIDEPAKTINITNGIAADGKLDLDTDVKSVIKEYFTAKDSDGITYDGMYYATGDWAGDYITDSDKHETITNVKALKEEGYVHLNVMVTNAKLKSSSTADSTNPKTGDNIFVAVSVMTVAASALAVAFYLNKKRAV